MMEKLLVAIVCFMSGVALMNNCITAITKGIREGIFINLKVSLIVSTFLIISSIYILSKIVLK